LGAPCPAEERCAGDIDARVDEGLGQAFGEVFEELGGWTPVVVRLINVLLRTSSPG
jgi:hypothetical protein